MFKFKLSTVGENMPTFVFVTSIYRFCKNDIINTLESFLSRDEPKAIVNSIRQLGKVVF